MSGLVRIRLMGAADDVSALADGLQAALGPRLAERSAPYANRRGEGVRVYLTVLADAPPTASQSLSPPTRELPLTFPES